MKKLLAILFYIMVALPLAAQQNNSNEEKIKKAVVLMKKMMDKPGEMQSIYTELQALKLTSAENKEAQQRMQQQALQGAITVKDAAMKTGGITEQKLTDWKEEKDRVIPVRDDARINSILKRDLNDAEIKAYCKMVLDAVKKELQPSVISHAEKIYAALKQQHMGDIQAGNAALSTYFSNLTQQSLYIYGKICSEANTNANNLNNYAAMLTMQGVQQAAIPVLNYLNRRYSKSPFVWSNLSVAWLGLGELNEAEKYADSCIRFFPGHSAQAQYVKSVIKNEEGEEQEAVEALQQSINLGYSADKNSLLKKKKAKPDVAYFRSMMPDDPMGLLFFQYPPMPLSYADAVATESQWKDYYAWIENTAKSLTEKIAQYGNSMKPQVIQYMAAKIKELENKKPVHTFSAANNSNLKMQEMSAVLEEEFSKTEEKFVARQQQLLLKKQTLKKQLEDESSAITKKYENTCGEGQPCPEAAICNAYLAAINRYMSAINQDYKKYYDDYLRFKRQQWNELVYCHKFFSGKDYFEAYQNNAQLNFITALKSVQYEFEPLQFQSACTDNRRSDKPFKMPNFKKVNCVYDLQLDMPLFSMKGCDIISISMKLVNEIEQMADVKTGEWTNGSLVQDEELAPINPIKNTTGTKTTTNNSGSDDEELAPIRPVKKIEFDQTGFTDYQTGGNEASKPAPGKNILLAGKPSFATMMELKNVSINYK